MNKQIPVSKIAFLSLIVLFLVTACGGQASTPITATGTPYTTTPEETPARSIC